MYFFNTLSEMFCSNSKSAETFGLETKPRRGSKRNSLTTLRNYRPNLAICMHLHLDRYQSKYQTVYNSAILKNEKDHIQDITWYVTLNTAYSKHIAF